MVRKVLRKRWDELGLKGWSIWISGEKGEGTPSEKAPQDQSQEFSIWQIKRRLSGQSSRVDGGVKSVTKESGRKQWHQSWKSLIFPYIFTCWPNDRFSWALLEYRMVKNIPWKMIFPFQHPSESRQTEQESEFTNLIIVNNRILTLSDIFLFSFHQIWPNSHSLSKVNNHELFHTEWNEVWALKKTKLKKFRGCPKITTSRSISSNYHANLCIVEI